MGNYSLDTSVLRANYDDNGNIILGSIMREKAPVAPQEIPNLRQETRAWTMLDETHTSIRAIKNPEPLAKPAKSPSVFHIAGTHAKSIIRESVKEGGKQLQETTADATRGVQHLRHALCSVPGRAAASMASFWRMAQTPVALPARKPGKRPPRKMTLFLIDTLRFGGTFGVIFGVLFVGINYESFWQIASAKLALGDTITTEQALSDITGVSQSKRTLYAAQGSSDANILAYLPAVGPYEDRLIIPKLGENVPIVRPGMDALMKEDWKKFEDDIQVALKDGVVHYPGSARPGQAGNFFLTGHSSHYPWDDGKYKDVFARLGELDIGDTYTVYYGGDRHTYRITDKYEVKPNNVSVLDQPTTQRHSTLMTCTPVGTTLRRLIVKAEEIDPRSGEVLKVGEKTTDEVSNMYTRLEALPI